MAHFMSMQPPKTNTNRRTINKNPIPFPMNIPLVKYRQYASYSIAVRKEAKANADATS
jgi:hypothetical protein